MNATDGRLPKLNANEQDELLSVLRKHAKLLLAKRSVTALDIGWIWTDGAPTGEVGIRVHVRWKRPADVVSEDDLVPQTLDGIPTDVLVFGRVNHAGQAFDPIVGGCETNTFRIGGRGTLGAIVNHDEEDGAFALSNYHVYGKGLGTLTIGANVHQPADGHDASYFGDIFDVDPGLDCAIAKLNGTRRGSAEIRDLADAIEGVADPVVGSAVSKSGATTSVTHGFIDGVSRRDQFTVVADSETGDEIADSGDSGAVWLYPDTKQAVGLHFGGTVENDVTVRAWAKRMNEVCKRLRIHF